MRELCSVKVRDVDIADRKYLGDFLGDGASKCTYLSKENGKVIKLPLGYSEDFYDVPVKVLDNINELDDYVYEIACVNEQLVWSLSQMATEVFIWEELLKLEKEGFDISMFARITDYYADKNDVFVIEQEKVDTSVGIGLAQWNDFCNKIEVINDELESRIGFSIRDIRRENCGIVDGRVVCFDFGLSTNDNCLCGYDSYNDYYYEDDEDYEESWC